MKKFTGMTLLLGVVVAQIGGFVAVGTATVVGFGGAGVAESALGLAPVSFEVPGIEWSNRPTFPTELREAALTRWVGILRVGFLLLILAAAVPVVFGALMTGAVFRPTLLVHRDVGAPARTLRRRSGRWALVVTAIAALFAGAFLLGLVPSIARAWSEVWSPRTGIGLSVGLLLTGSVLAVGLVISWALWQTGGLFESQAKARRHAEPSVGGLSLLQAAASTVVIVLAVAVLGDARPATLTDMSDEAAQLWVGVQANTPIDSAALINALSSRADVEAVGATTPGGWEGLGVHHHVLTQCGNCWTGDIATPMLGGRARIIGVAGDALRLLGVEVIEGTPLAQLDATDSDASLVSVRFGGRMFEGGEAIGRAVFIGSDLAPHNVAGIVSDPLPVKGLGAPRPFADRVYLSLQQHPVPNMEIVVRGAISEASLQSVLAPMLPDATRIDIQSFVEHREKAAAPAEWISNLLLALLVGCVLLSLLTGVLAARLQVRTRQYEIGVRRAVGATRGRVWVWVLKAALSKVGWGVVLGLWLALFFREPLVRLLGGEVSFGQAMIFAAALQLGAGLLGALPATARAAHWDPQQALRTRMGGSH